jgi:hypothetical protein
MPQTLTDSWKEALGENWETVHELLLHTVGNLTLTGYNAPLSNDDYRLKREILLNSHLELNRYFEPVIQWDDQSIRTRAEVLADRALQIWSYFGQEQSELDSPVRGVTGTTPTGLVILGQRFSVSTWREVAQITLEQSHERDSELFEQMLAQFPRFFGRDPSRFRSSRPLANGLFFETNLSATSIHRLCVQVAELSGMSSEDWHVEYAPSENRQPEPETGEKRADSAEFGLSSVERSGRHIGVTFARLRQARYESAHGVRFVGLSSKAYVYREGRSFGSGLPTHTTNSSKTLMPLGSPSSVTRSRPRSSSSSQVVVLSSEAGRCTSDYCQEPRSDQVLRGAPARTSTCHSRLNCVRISSAEASNERHLGCPPLLRRELYC